MLVGTDLFEETALPEMKSSPKYTKLPNPVAPLTNNGPDKFAFPKISRFKCAAVLFVSVLALIIMLFTCLQTNHCTVSAGCQVVPDSPNDVLANQQEEKQDRMKFRHMKKRLPQCLVIGVRKAGTRALLTYLNIHSDIVTKGREMHYFDDDTINHMSNESLEAYRKDMPYSFEHQLTIEKTPAYFTEPDVPERVYRMNNSIRLLLVLREPVERTHSDYLQITEGKIAKNKEYFSFEEHVFDKNGNINRSYKGISRSVYHKHLKRWLGFFSLNQIFIVDSAELVKNPASVMYEIENFLGLAHEIKPSNFYFNKTKGFYCVKTESQQKCLAESKGRKHPELDPDVVYKLKRFFRPHNQKLYAMIGRDFDWDDE